MVKKTIILILSSITFTSCKSDSTEEKYILTTTQMLYDIAINLLDTTFKIDYLMKEGTDPHLYKFSQVDLRKLNKATVVIVNGLHLEGKMNFVLQKISHKKTVISVGDSLDKKLLIPISERAYDPHIWFDIHLWKKVTRVVSNNLKKIYPNYKSIIQEKENNYINQLNYLEEYIKKEIEKIPTSQRVLITSHDAFRYFEKAWKFPVKALQGISTDTEYGIKDINELVDFIYLYKIKAVFAETSLSPKGLMAVVEGVKNKGLEVKIVEGLYSDAMGSASSPEGTYIGMYKSNVKKIVEALK